MSCLPGAASCRLLFALKEAPGTELRGGTMVRSPRGLTGHRGSGRGAPGGRSAMRVASTTSSTRAGAEASDDDFWRLVNLSQARV